MTDNKQFFIKKKYDLCQDSVLDEFFNEAKEHLFPAPKNFNEFNDIIKYSKSILNKDYLCLEGGRFCYLHALFKHSIGFDFFEQVWPVLFFIYFHQGLSNFRKLILNLNNVSQASSTIFEIECMQLFERNKWNILEYEPTIYENLRRKNPEFNIQKDNIELFVECKSIHFETSKAFTQFNRRSGKIHSVFPKEELDILNKKRLRIEIQFDKLPSEKNVNKFLEKIKEFKGNNELYIVRAEEKIGDIRFVIRQQTELAYFSSKSIRSAQALAGPVARKLSFDEKEPYEVELSISSHDLYRKQIKIIANLITKARKQLPDNKLSIILLDGVRNPLADEPAKIRLGTKEYSNIIAVVTNPFYDCWARYKIDAKNILRDLFGGLPNGDPFI
jgi:hypothetical protein